MTSVYTTRLDNASMADTARKDTLPKYVQMEGNVKLAHAQGATLELANTLKSKESVDFMNVLMLMK